MNKSILLISMLFGAPTMNAQEVKKVEIETSAICEMCKETILYDLTFTKGIKEADLDLENKVVTVAFKDNKITLDAIRERIANLGYNADSVMRNPEAYENLPFCCKDGGGRMGH